MAMRNPSLDQLAQRHHAMTVACTYCGAKADEPCIRTDYRTGEKRPVENFPAHLPRINRANRARSAAVQADCPHDSWSGDEGPVSMLGRMPKRWTCDGCGITKWENA